MLVLRVRVLVEDADSMCVLTGGGAVLSVAVSAPDATWSADVAYHTATALRHAGL